MWENATKTLKGIALDQKLAARSLPLKLKCAKSGGSAVNATQLTVLEELSDIKQELDLKGAYLSEDGQVVTIPVTLSNEGVEERYALYQVGVYAEDPEAGNILYFVAQTDVRGGEIIPAAEESPGYSIDWYFALKVSGAAEIEVVLNEAGRLTVGQADLRYAPIVDPVLEGVPEAPTAPKGTNSGQIATTGFVMEGLADKAEKEDLKVVKTDLEDHIGDTGNPHGVTKTQIGLGAVDDTADIAKPVSTVQQAALDALYEQLTAYTRAKIADLIAGAPATMDTLKEISDAIAAHKTVTDALDAAIGKKASAAEFDSHVKDKTAHVTAAERTSWTGKMEKNGDASNATAAFTEAASRVNIATGEKLSVILGKIKRFFTDLKAVAFSGSYSDLSNKPGNMGGASTSAAGASGFVPAPAKGAANRYLRSDGTWSVPPDTNSWRPAQNSLTSTSTTDALTAAQGKILNDKITTLNDNALTQRGDFDQNGQVNDHGTGIYRMTGGTYGGLHGDIQTGYGVVVVFHGPDNYTMAIVYNFTKDKIGFFIQLGKNSHNYGWHIF